MVVAHSLKACSLKDVRFNDFLFVIIAGFMAKALTSYILFLWYISTSFLPNILNIDTQQMTEWVSPLETNQNLITSIVSNGEPQSIYLNEDAL